MLSCRFSMHLGAQATASSKILLAHKSISAFGAPAEALSYLQFENDRETQFESISKA